MGRLEVDHIIPLDLGGAPWALSNVQVLCVGCHIAKTRAENTRPPSAEKTAWGEVVSRLLDTLVVPECDTLDATARLK